MQSLKNVPTPVWLNFNLMIPFILKAGKPFAMFPAEVVQF